MTQVTHPLFFHKRHCGTGQGLIAARGETFRLAGGGAVKELDIWGSLCGLGRPRWAATQSLLLLTLGPVLLPPLPPPQCEHSAFCVLIQKGTFLSANVGAMVLGLALAKK